MRNIPIRHESSRLLLADGPIGWRITPFEGNFYNRRKFLHTDRFKVNYLPGLCIYKFLYVWLDLHIDPDRRVANTGWMYRLPNPLLPFIWFRVAVTCQHPAIEIEEY